MPEMRIANYPDPVLRTPAEEVEEIDDEVHRLAATMIETMYANRGVGLAAPQVGVGRRVIVFNLTDDPSRAQVLVNPRLVRRSGGSVEEEGCLSVPGIQAKIRRAQHVVVEGYTLDGELITIEADDLFARMFQHELDHLEGTLFVDKMSPASRVVYESVLAEMEEKYRSQQGV